MIAYEIQLRYVIRDKIRDKKFSLRQNSVKENPRKRFFVRKKIVRQKNCLRHCLRFPVCKVAVLDKLTLIITASSMYKNINIITTSVWENFMYYLKEKTFAKDLIKYPDS